MSYLTDSELKSMGFASLGQDVRISSFASFNRPHEMSIGDNSRIDDFCALSGAIEIGRNVHIAVQSSLVASRERIKMNDFSGLAFGCHIFSSSDDYSGMTMTNPTVPAEFKSITHGEVLIGRHVIIGTSSIVFPGVSIADGCSVGALSIVTKSTEPWGIYLGNPARRVKERSKDLLELESLYILSTGEQKKENG